MRHHPEIRDVPFADRARFNLMFLLEHYLPEARAVQARKEAARRRIVEHVARGGPGRVIPIDRVKGLTPERFRREYLRRGIPVIMDGAAADWRCVREWTFDSLRARFGERRIHIVDRPGLTDDDYVDTREMTETLRFADFLDEVLGGGRRYMRFEPLFDSIPELAEDIDWDFLRGMPDWSFGMIPQVFIGGDGKGTPIHNAMTTFLFAQVLGVKRWLFVPNRYLAVLNPPADARGYNHSGAVVEAPDPAAYPGLDSVDVLEAVLQPGDILYNPSWNWHSVKNTGATIGIRFGMLRPTTMVGESLTLMLIRMFGGRNEGVALSTSIASARDALRAVGKELRARQQSAARRRGR